MSEHSPALSSICPKEAQPTLCSPTPASAKAESPHHWPTEHSPGINPNPCSCFQTNHILHPSLAAWMHHTTAWCWGRAGRASLQPSKHSSLHWWPKLESHLRNIWDPTGFNHLMHFGHFHPPSVSSRWPKTHHSTGRPPPQHTPSNFLHHDLFPS